MQAHLDHLFATWQALKLQEQQATKARLKAEQAIEQYLKHHKQWQSFGTMSFAEYHIRIKYNRKWDQKKLVEVRDKHFTDPSQFPFIDEYKEIVTHSRMLALHEPYLWQQLRHALTLRPLKPYFFRATHPQFQRMNDG